MYTAIQAQNIAAERVNHKFYRHYRTNVRRVMSAITRNADHGYTNARVYIRGCARLEVNALKQIGEELVAYGYTYNVATEKMENGKISWYIEVSWQ